MSPCARKGERDTAGVSALKTIEKLKITNIYIYFI